MASNYRVARGTVREALMQLAEEGLVEIRPGSGSYVSFDASHASNSVVENARPLELIDARFALEPHICRLAVLHAQRQDFDRAEALLEQMEASAHDGAAFSEADTAFHMLLAEVTGNSLLLWMVTQINSVRGQQQWARMRTLTLTPRVIETYNLQHRRVLTAIRKREPEEAAGFMKAHLETARLSLTRAAET
jgi:GntR family uxuAB operon transcriptional repressor